MNSYERTRRICKVIVLVFGILSINNIILTIRNYSYAYFEKNVKTGVKLKITTLDEMPGKYATDTIKATLGITDGIIGVTNDSEKVTTKSDNIREYRYSGTGVDNYIYFNCSDGITYENADSNCERWRIIGVFKDESGAEHLKIVNNNVLTWRMFPVTFVANGITYKIRDTDTSSNNYAYWDSQHTNNWATAGLQYWLNAGSDKETKQSSDGYMSYLSKNAKNMIEETKYYLGNIIYNEDTASSAYINERGSVTCSDDCSGGDVLSGNSATWIGKIALMYPSDYGYSVSSSYWNDRKMEDYIGDYIGDYYIGGPRDTSWLYKNANHNVNEWLLSPEPNYKVYYSNAAAQLTSGGWLASHPTSTASNAVRPCLYLKSKVKITDGIGSYMKPYFINLES